MDELPTDPKESCAEKEDRAKGKAVQWTLAYPYPSYPKSRISARQNACTYLQLWMVCHLAIRALV